MAQSSNAVNVLIHDQNERPEEPYDSRSLYDRLKEQRDKKDLEYEKAHKLKNLIRGLDDDEINFLDIVDKAKLDAERQQQIQEYNELNEFRQRVTSLQEQTIDKKISIEKAAPKPKATNASSRLSQRSILAGVVRKRPACEQTESGCVKSNNIVPEKMSKSNGNDVTTSKVSQSSSTNPSEKSENSTGKKIDLSVHDRGAMKCIGILPGIGKYRDSSDSEKSTDTDDDFDFSDFDWVGRKVKKNNDDSCHE